MARKFTPYIPKVHIGTATNHDLKQVIRSAARTLQSRAKYLSDSGVNNIITNTYGKNSGYNFGTKGLTNAQLRSKAADLVGALNSKRSTITGNEEINAKRRATMRRFVTNAKELTDDQLDDVAYAMEKIEDLDNQLNLPSDEIRDYIAYGFMQGWDEKRVSTFIEDLLKGKIEKPELVPIDEEEQEKLLQKSIWLE